MFRKRLLLSAVLVAAISIQPGCAVLEPVRSSMKMFMPNSNGYRDTTGEDDDGWSFVGTEGRGDRAMEKPDPMDRVMMSPKARSIDRNFNINH